MRPRPGSPFPLGATFDGDGVNFALFSEHASAVELCLFEPDAAAPLTENTHGVWHGYLPGLRPGRRYGYRVDGPWAPDQGHLFNRAKLLVNPYARALTGPARWSELQLGYRADDPAHPDLRDSAGVVPRALVIDPAFDWAGDRAPRTPWSRTVIYEAHVRGLTKRHPGVAPELRGTYLGLCAEPVLDHLRGLGVTAVELLPVHHVFDERHLVERGLANYWGYAPLAFFAPDARFALGDPVRELKTMVRELHRAGLEVLLDVVFNHTGEGDHLGPTLSLRGIDNASYYRLRPHDARHYEDLTGCGNTLEINHVRALQLVLDCLRYWVQEMHVDGFRFDLAPVLGRDARGFHPGARFFAAVAQDPVLAPVKLIAEPWDLGGHGYQLGHFPRPWAEWNDRYRDTVRHFWRGDRGQVAALASRLSGSSDLFGARGAAAGVNYLAAHDGFTLADLVRYEHKHNQRNGEDNRDGTDHHLSRNWGVEGDSDDPALRGLRARLQRAFLATLALSQGVPMIAHGDELGRTQGGNNNAYCQDNELTWVDWELDDERRALLEFARRAFALRAAHPVLRRRRHFTGHAVGEAGPLDIEWLRPDGAPMTGADWGDPHRRALAALIDGRAADEHDAEGAPLYDDTLLLCCNGGAEPCELTLPPGKWRLLLASEDGAPGPGAGTLRIDAHALAVLCSADQR